MLRSRRSPLGLPVSETAANPTETATRPGDRPRNGIGSKLKAIVRLLVVVGATGVGYLSLVLLVPARRPAPGFHLRARNRVFRVWARALARTLGMRMHVEGEPPSGAFFLVSNHLSYMDIMLLASHVDAAFVAKADLHGWPFVGRAFAAADTIFVDRSRRRDVVRVIDRIGACLDRSLGVILFPEGTSGKGDVLLPFKASILDLPARSQVPVSWATIHYRTRIEVPAHEAICWWGDTDFLPHIWGLAQMPGFDGSIRFGEQTVCDNDRKRLAQGLHSAMLEGFEPSA